MICQGVLRVRIQPLGTLKAVGKSAATSKEELQLGEAQRPNMTQLPGICVTLLGGHECHCDGCDPRFQREIETKMIRKIYKDNTATIGAEAKNRITREVTVRYQERIEEVLAELEAAKRKKFKGVWQHMRRSCEPKSSKRWPRSGRLA